MIGAVRSARQWSSRLYGATITNRPIGSRRLFDADTMRLNYVKGTDADLFINGVYRASHRSDSLGQITIPLDLLYGITLAELEVFHVDGSVTRTPFRIQIDEDCVPVRRLHYQLTGGYDPDRGTPEGHGLVSYGLTSWLTIGSTIDMVGTFDRSFATYAGATATARLSYSSIITAAYVPGIALQATAGLSPLNGWRIDAEATIFEERAWSDGRAFGLRPATRYTSLSTRLNLMATQVCGLPLSFTALYRGIRQTDDALWHDLDWNATYATPLLTIAVRTRHDLYGAAITSVTQATMDLRYPSNGWASSILGGLRLTLEGTSSWNSFQPSWRYAAEKRWQLGSLQWIVGVTGSDQASVGLYTSAVVRLEEFRVAVEGRREGNSSILHTGISGGIRVDDAEWDLEFDRQLRTASSAVLLVCFEDLDLDGVRDADERLLNEIGISNSMGRRRQHPNGGIMITDLQANAEYTFTLDRSSVHDPFLSLTAETISVTTEPHHTTAVYIPLRPSSIIEGIVSSTTPKAGVVITITDATGRTRTQTTFSDGSFTFTGIEPGAYTLMLADGPSINIAVSDQPGIVPVSL